jgi:hypothetical protein
MAEGLNTKAAGRLAGLAYLVIILFSLWGYATLSRLLTGSSDLVLARVATNRAVFTLAFVVSAIGFAAWVVLGILLYRLMSSAGRTLGLLMLIFVVAGTAMNLVALSQLLPLIRSASSGLQTGALTTTVDSYNRLLLLAQVFSGLWLFPFGWLVLRSRIAPRFLGICLLAGGLFYLLVFATAFKPALEHMMAYRVVSTPTGILGFLGELGMCLWLLFRGANEPNLERAA